MDELLKKSNLKSTKGREKILSILASSKFPKSAEEIFKLFSKDEKINLSTVYRILLALTKKGIIIKQIGQNKIATYQLNNESHKHLFICTNCHKRITLQNCPLEKAIDVLSKENNFKVCSHNIELYGLCFKCLK